MADPELTISIPTYNRLAMLRQTLDVLLPQVTDEVEVVICDNRSPDGTVDFVKALRGAGHRISLASHPANVGSDKNVISCFSQGSAPFIWLLCDDDLPCSNAVESLLAAIRRHGAEGPYYFYTKGSDKTVSDYSAAAVDTAWSRHGRDGFARKIGAWVTFASSMVIRRDQFQRDFVQQQIGTGLVSASIVLAAVGSADCAVVSDKPLLYAREGDGGRYDAYPIFTRNLYLLLEQVRQFGYGDEALRHIFADNLANVMPHVIAAFPASRRSLEDLIRYGFQYKEFYTRVVPALVKAKTGLAIPRPRWTRGLPTRIARMASRSVRAQP